jgi:hypothetical protein
LLLNRRMLCPTLPRPPRVTTRAARHLTRPSGAGRRGTDRPGAQVTASGCLHLARARPRLLLVVATKERLVGRSLGGATLQRKAAVRRRWHYWPVRCSGCPRLWLPPWHRRPADVASPPVSRVSAEAVERLPATNSGLDVSGEQPHTDRHAVDVRCVLLLAPLVGPSPRRRRQWLDGSMRAVRKGPGSARRYVSPSR